MTLLLALAVPGASLALPGDRDEPIEIRAEHAEIDDERGVAIYSGSVRMDQGTLRVTAERLTIHTENNDIVRITAEGDRAHYQQLPEPGAELVHADARTIVYHTREQRVELQGDARLRQAEDEFTGAVIRYDIREKRVRAQSEEGAPVRMVIQPGRVGAASQSGEDAPERPSASEEPAAEPDAGSGPGTEG